ncbi:putative host specificity protein, partial [Escherichia coli EC1856]
RSRVLRCMTRRYSLSSGFRKRGLPISGRLKPQPATLARGCTG